jgi:protein SCO1
MLELNRRKLLALAALTPFAAALPEGATSKFSASVGVDESREHIRKRYFPDLTLLTQDNKPVKFYQDLVKDKIVLFSFFYAHCEGICPIVTANLARVQKLLGERVGRDIFINSITLKPVTDTPQVLKEYAEMHGIMPGWALLTGKPDDVEQLRRSLGFTNLDPVLDRDKSQHIGNIRYGSEPLMQWTALPGMTRPESIAKAIERDFPEIKGRYPGQASHKTSI